MSEPRVMPEQEICDECGHEVSRHGVNGCQHNRTIHADGIAMDGPCGCMEWESESVTVGIEETAERFEEDSDGPQ